MSQRRFISAVGLVAGLVVGLASAPAVAGEPVDAEALVSKGVALRQEGKDAEALALFRQAYDKAPTARARAQMGLAEQALGMWLKAEEDLKAAIDSTDPWVERYRDPLDSALRTVRGRLGSLELVVNVPNAEVLVDGAAAAGAAGRPLRVEAGTRTVVVRAAGFHQVSRSVVVPGGGVARETFDLAPDRGEASPGLGADQGARSPRTEDGSSQRTLGFALLGGSALLLAGGLTSQLIRVGVVNDYNDDRTCLGENVPSQPPDCEDRISAARTWQTLAIVGYAVGGALALSGAVVLFTAPPRPRASSAKAPERLPPGCAPTVDAHGASLVCAGRF